MGPSRAEQGNAAAGTGLGATAVVKQPRRLRIRAGQRPTAVERGLLPGGPPKVAASCHRRGARCSCRVTASPFLAGGKLPTVPQSGCFGYDKFGCLCLIVTPKTFILSWTVMTQQARLGWSTPMSVLPVAVSWSCYCSTQAAPKCCWRHPEPHNSRSGASAY